MFVSSAKNEQKSTKRCYIRSGCKVNKWSRDVIARLRLFFKFPLAHSSLFPSQLTLLTFEQATPVAPHVDASDTYFIVVHTPLVVDAGCKLIRLPLETASAFSANKS